MTTLNQPLVACLLWEGDTSVIDLIVLLVKSPVI